jgi:hypothetical protein
MISKARQKTRNGIKPSQAARILRIFASFAEFDIVLPPIRNL